MKPDQTLPRRPRGRPAASGQCYSDTKTLLIQQGIVLLTERGVSATSIDAVLKVSQIPKGSFYHYFSNKQVFTLAVMDAYDGYFCRKLQRLLTDPTVTPMARLAAFVDSACRGITRFDYQRGCLIGNLGQEVTQLDEQVRLRLEAILCGWEAMLQGCFAKAVAAGELPVESDCAALAHVFWVGWEGAVLRARLVKSTAPMHAYFEFFQRVAMGS
ncbi:MAG: TetR family transcriptional regulator C-terminal domain-containing protein [Aeromonas sp.]